MILKWIMRVLPVILAILTFVSFVLIIEMGILKKITLNEMAEAIISIYNNFFLIITIILAITIGYFSTCTTLKQKQITISIINTSLFFCIIILFLYTPIIFISKINNFDAELIDLDYLSFLNKIILNFINKDPIIIGIITILPVCFCLVLLIYLISYFSSYKKQIEIIEIINEKEDAYEKNSNRINSLQELCNKLVFDSLSAPNKSEIAKVLSEKQKLSKKLTVDNQKLKNEINELKKKIPQI